MARISDSSGGGGGLTSANFFQQFQNVQQKKPAGPARPAATNVNQQFRQADQAAAKKPAPAAVPVQPPAPPANWLEAAAQRFRETANKAVGSAASWYAGTLPGQLYGALGQATGITPALANINAGIQKAANWADTQNLQPRQTFGEMFTQGLADARKFVTDPGGYMGNLIQVAPGVWLPKDSPAARAYTTDNGEGDALRKRYNLQSYTQVGQALYPKGSILDRTSRGDYSGLKPYVDQNNPGFDTEKRYFYNPAQYNWGPPIPDNTGRSSGNGLGGSGYGSGYGRGGGGGGRGGSGYGASDQVSNFYNQLANWRVIQIQGG